ncbi:MAG: phosphate acetyltransferase [Candidatus Kryptonium sp.]|nr:phosphate acetyltransferase [Candidatus Kryptonium sp.]MCX7761807.1 phosphate acetyltransferase [Candidatus Kryptonium sp.]MDW8109804.1 phosphate acetyltransferase [Candidatus Kryptonium sp.]
MTLLEKIREKAKQLKKHIVLPDALDERTLKAARIIVDEKIANITLIGDEEKIYSLAEKIDVNLSGIRIVDPLKSEKLQDFSQIFYNLRKHKGISFEQAKETMKNPLFFGAMMVREGYADGSVAGSISTTADVLKAGIQVVGLMNGISIVSSFFLIVFPNKVYSFADCGVVPNPTAEELADIAIATAINHKKLTGEEPIVAMLSFSTKGSAKHEMVDKVVQATQIAKQKMPELIIDGELQLDAAIVPEVAKRKAPDSPVKGNANVLIFPNLDAGNIGYKMAQRMAGAEALGPLVQGLKKPCFDLSRGCSVEDIVNVVAINCVMS